jgi:PAS domain S-box-containing protein
MYINRKEPDMKSVTDQTNEILIVDDIDDNVRLLTSILSSEGFSVCTASNCQMAMQNARNKLPAVILLDIVMPGIDGFEICRNLKADRLTQSLPVIFISALSDESSKLKGFESGGVDYITKPFKKEEVLACVRSHLSISDLISSKERQAHRLQYVSEQLELETLRRKNSEAKLKDSEELFDRVVQCNPVGMYLCELNEGGQLIIKNSNPAADRILRTNYKILIGKPFLEVFPKLNYSSVPDMLFQVAIGELDNQTFEIEYRNDKTNGIFEVTVFGVGINSIAVNFLDVTQRRLSSQNDRILLRTLIDNLPVAVYIKDQQGRKIIANTADIENIGVKHESQVIGKTDIELFIGETGSRGYLDDMHVIQTGQSIINKEEVFTDKTGAFRWLLTSKMPLFDDSGKITGLVGIGRDITERKKEKEQINRLSKSIEQIPISFVITDVNGVIEYVNPKFCEKTGYSSKEVLGRMSRILNPGKMSTSAYEQLWEIITAGNIWRGEFLNRKKNGELYWEWAMIAPIKDEHGRITNFIAVNEDISKRKQMETDLIAAKEKAEESDRLKSAFLANMSHEVRTPLNGIIGFSELLGDSFFDEEQKKEFVQHIIRNGNSLLSIINDIMDISKMESGEVKIRQSIVDVKKLLFETRDQYLILSREKNIGFNLEIRKGDFSEPVLVFADADRLRQILSNLINNAFKFTINGSISMGYRYSGDMIEFHVKDTGIGIPKEYQELIFDRFRQVETSYARKFGGAGLGLAISKNLVEMMGGKIWLLSQPGRGSIFYFSLPIHH